MQRRVRRFLAQWRLMAVVGSFSLLYLVLVGHLYSIQVEQRPYYSARAQSQYRLAGFLNAQRGNIFFQDKNGTLIQAAIMKEMPAVFAVPKEIGTPQETAMALAQTIPGTDEDELVRILSKGDDPYEPIAKKVSDAVVDAIKKLKLGGIYIDEEPNRFYPLGSMFAHALGFVGPAAEDEEAKGRYGLELFYEEELRGLGGEFSEDNLIKPPTNGSNLILTVDYTIQRKAEAVLRALVEKHGAGGGSVIVEDPQTGRILAMASHPTFDPNEYSHYSIATFINPVAQSIYEPGSVFKVMTMAIGIETGKLTPDTTYVDKGYVTFDGRTIRNWDLKTRGELTMAQVLEHSVNTGAVFAERLIGHDLFYNYLISFGFNEPTGIDLPGELKGSLANLRTQRDINFATASFGQGVSVTPISLTNAIAAIANRGILMRPYIVERIVNAEGGIIEERKPEFIRRVIGERTAEQVIDMMVAAVRTNIIADIPSYEVAGKTGTAQVPNLAGGGYYEDQVINSYTGFAPATNPRFVILIKLDKPLGAPLAGQTVVPAFRELAEFILNYYEIPPDSL